MSNNDTVSGGESENVVLTTLKSTWKKFVAGCAAALLAVGLFFSNCGDGCGTAASPDAGTPAAVVDAAAPVPADAAAVDAPSAPIADATTVTDAAK